MRPLLKTIMSDVDSLTFVTELMNVESIKEFVFNIAIFYKICDTVLTQ